MKTISQVAKLTGVSVRTLQYYDEIGLLKPSQVTFAGYRLYNKEALETLQQILFFKELDFKLTEIKEIVQNPQFNKHAAYSRQKELLLLKRQRIDNLIALLEKLEKGEQCMSFKEFDLSKYFEALEQFKEQNSDDVIKYWGSMESFNQFIEKGKANESKVAELAIKQFGSIEKYTEAIKYQLEHFSELMEKFQMFAENKDQLMEKNDALYSLLTADMTRDVSSKEIHDIVKEIMDFSKETSMGLDMGEGYWDMVIESYSHDAVKKYYDEKYGKGAAAYIAEAFKTYLHKII